jgi:uncharacterized protein (DUF4213/DUF364 family)
MKVLEDLLAWLVHDAPVKEARVGVFWTAVLSRGLGLASTQRPDCPAHEAMPLRGAGTLRGRSAQELGRLVLSDRPLEATVGMAAINSLIEVDETLCTAENASAVLRRKGSGVDVAIVGHFPFVDQLRAHTRNLWVFERRPRPGDLLEDAMVEYLPRTRVLGLSATTLLNHSFERIMALCPAECFVIMIGSTTPMSPVLFDHGVDMLAGSKVCDPGMVLRCVEEGAAFRQVNGVRLLTLRRSPDK